MKTLRNVDSIGIVTFRDGINVVVYVSVVTAFHGDGANLTGVSGFSTALSNTQGTLENLCIQNNRIIYNWCRYINQN